MMDAAVIGLLGSVLLAACAIPAALDALLTKRCHINKWMLYLWMTGEILCLGYALYISGPMLPLIINYSLNILCLIPMIYYRKDTNG